MSPTHPTNEQVGPLRRPSQPALEMAAQEAFAVARRRAQLNTTKAVGAVGAAGAGGPARAAGVGEAEEAVEAGIHVRECDRVERLVTYRPPQPSSPTRWPPIQSHPAETARGPAAAAGAVIKAERAQRFDPKVERTQRFDWCLRRAGAARLVILATYAKAPP